MHKGRQFELLVARIEKSLAKDEVLIESPAYLPDVDTGDPREVDIALRSKVGSSSILIVIECRDHARKQGVAWIEQLIQKRKSVGASNLVAVSRNGFSQKALTKAELNGIETRVYQTVDPGEIKDWLSGIGVEAFGLCYEALGGKIGFREPPPFGEGEYKITWHDDKGSPAYVFKDQLTGRMFNTITLFGSFYFEKTGKSLPSENFNERKELWIERSFNEEQLLCLTDRGYIGVAGMLIGFAIDANDLGLTVSSVHKYTGQENTIATEVSWKGTLRDSDSGTPIELQAVFTNRGHWGKRKILYAKATSLVLGAVWLLYRLERSFKCQCVRSANRQPSAKSGVFCDLQNFPNDNLASFGKGFACAPSRGTRSAE